MAHEYADLSRSEARQQRITIAFLVLAWFFIWLRIWTRTYVISNFGWDDSIMILAGVREGVQPYRGVADSDPDDLHSVLRRAAFHTSQWRRDARYQCGTTSTTHQGQYTLPAVVFAPLIEIVGRNQ